MTTLERLQIKRDYLRSIRKKYSHVERQIYLETAHEMKKEKIQARRSCGVVKPDLFEGANA